MGLNQIPNAITLIRIILVIPFAYMLLSRNYPVAFIIFVVAGVSDAVDGFLARRFHWRSRFGAIVDPIADKLLLITTYVLLTWLGHLPLWLVLLIFGRDAIIVVGGLLFHYKIHHFDIEPTLLGKLCTFTQISYVVLLLTHLAGFVALAEILEGGLYVVTVVTVVSGLHYVAIWAWRTKRALSTEE